MMEKKLRIMIVDNDESARITFRGYVRNIMKKHGVEADIETATDGADAEMKISRKSGKCLIITDYKLPKVNGAQLHSRLPTKFRESMIFVTSNPAAARTSLEETSPGAQVPPILAKPLSEEQLERSLRQCIA